MKKTLIFLILISQIFIFGCAKQADDIFEDAILEANFLMSDNKCTEARDLLLTVGSAATANTYYLKVLSSTYACSGGHSDLDFFTDASTKLNSSSTDFLNSLATFDNSVNETAAESTEFQSMMTGIQVLTEGGGNSAGTHAGRLAIFGESNTQSLNLQALFLTTAAIGKYVHFYGDADATTGLKTTCVYTYTKAISQAAVLAGPAPASCNAGSGYAGGNAGVTANAVRRACQGIVLYNQLINLFVNTTLTNADDYGDLDLVYANISTAYDTYCGQNANTQTTCDFKTVQSCVDEYDGNNSFIDYIELYLAAIIENTFL